MQYRQKVAAGGIVVRAAAGGGFEVVLVQHNKHHGWGFPKGHLEDNETPQEAALREVEEETGVRATIIDDVGITRYQFTNEKGKRIDKRVHWYLMEYSGEGEQTTAHEVAGIEWVPVDKVIPWLTFANDQKLYEQAEEQIERYLEVVKKRDGDG